MDELSLPIVGIDFANDDKAKTNRRFELMQCAPGDRLDLLPEPKNKADEHAIAVFSASGIQVGYLPSDRAAWLGKRIRREPCLAIFQGMVDSAAFVRIRFGGEAPTLPPARSTPPRPIVTDVDENGDARITRHQFDFEDDCRIEGFDWGA